MQIPPDSAVKRKIVTFEYLSGQADKPRKVQLQVGHVHVLNKHWYLSGIDLRDKTHKSFKVANIVGTLSVEKNAIKQELSNIFTHSYFYYYFTYESRRYYFKVFNELDS